MRLEQLIRLWSQPLAIDPRTLVVGQTILARKLAGASVSGQALHAELGIASREGGVAARTASAREARIAVIPVVGLIAQRAHSLGASTEQIGAAFDAALGSKQVDAILLDVDSPGGTISGVPELAAKIRESRKVKPTLALANSLAASAAYWIGSAADEFWMVPSGEAGSIGVYTLHEDWSGALAKDGIAVTAISAGKYKLEGAPWQPLTEEARMFLQASVDEAYDWFVRDVALQRRDTQTNVRSGYGEGRVLGAADALKANLADRIGTWEDAIARLVSKVGGKSAGRMALMREQLALEAARTAA